jgi:hypothetical protein
MRSISFESYAKPRATAAGTAPVLQWLPVTELVVDPAYQPLLQGRCRRSVERIAASFSWCRFAAVVVAPMGEGKFAIIDGQLRTTAAALVGFKKVPCLIVAATREEQAAAYRAINQAGPTVSRMAQHIAGLFASEPSAVQLADVCARAEVELLRYPVPADRQSAGQTMAVGAISQCLKRYGEETLITALQCVTQTTNNIPGALSARTIKALCAVLGGNHALRDSGLRLLEIFDTIDLASLSTVGAGNGGQRKINPVQLITDRIRSEIVRVSVEKIGREKSVHQFVNSAQERRIAFLRLTERPARTKHTSRT